MSIIGRLRILLSADSSKLQSDFNKATKKSKKASQDIRDSFNQISGAATVISGAFTAAAAVITTQAAQSAVELAKVSDQIDINIISLQAMRKAANDFGVSSDQMDDALKDLTERVGEASREGGTYAETIEKLGLNINDLAKQQPDQLFRSMTDAINQLSTTQEKNFVIAELMGDEQKALINLMEEGSQVFDIAEEKITKTGAALTQLEAAKLTEMNKALDDAKLAGTGLFNAISVNVAPIITELSKRFFNVSLRAGGFRDVVKDAMSIVTQALAHGANAVKGLSLTFTGLELVVNKVFKFILGSFDGFLSGIGDAVEFMNDILGTEIKPPKLDILKDMMLTAEARTEELKQTFDGIFIEVADGAAGKAVETFFQKAIEESEIKAQEIAERTKQNNESGKLNEGEKTGKNQLPILDEQAYLEELELKHQQKLIDIQKIGIKARFDNEKRDMVAKIAFQSAGLANIFGTFAGGSRKMFELQKKFSLAQAIVALPSAVVQSYRNAGGFPLGIPAAIAMAATGLAQINQIRSQSFSGGGGNIPAPASVSAPSFSNALTAPEANDDVFEDNQEARAAVPSREVNITLNGAGYSSEDVRQLIAQINEESGDNVQLNAA